MKNINTKKIKIGNVCVCKRGIVGIVTKKQKNKYKGITLSGKAWESKSPMFLANNILETALGGHLLNILGGKKESK